MPKLFLSRSLERQPVEFLHTRTVSTIAGTHFSFQSCVPCGLDDFGRHLLAATIDTALHIERVSTSRVTKWHHRSMPGPEPATVGA